MFIDPLYFDNANSTLKNIDLYVNDSMHRAIYNKSLFVSKQIENVNSKWYINGKDVKKNKEIGYNIVNKNNMFIDMNKYTQKCKMFYNKFQ